MNQIVEDSGGRRGNVKSIGAATVDAENIVAQRGQFSPTE